MLNCREFLTGFHKRKLQRKKKAQEELQRQLKEERKRLKTEARESYKKLLVSHRPVPEVEHLLKEEYEDDDVNVKVVELSTDAISDANNWIGPNRVKYETNEEPDVDIKQEEEEIPGMGLKIKKEKPEMKQEFESQLDVKKTLKKQATRNVKKSKVFQLKNKMERQKQKKKSLQQKKQRQKFNKQHNNHGKKHSSR